jgi:hypothetical protein
MMLQQTLFRSAICILALSFVGCTPNEAEDGVPPDTGEALVIQETTERKVLHEAFSGSNCGPCEPAAKNVARVLDANPGKYTLLKYQLGSDPYISYEASRRRMYYLPGESSYGIPFVHADGENGFHPNLMNEEAGYQQEDFDGFYAAPAYVEMSVTAEIVDQTVSWEIDILPLMDISGKRLILHTAIVEGTTYNNVGSNGQTEFHQVMKKMVPDHKGTKMDDLPAEEALHISGSYTFQGEYAEGASYSDQVDHSEEHTVEDFEDLGVVVWLQNSKTWEVFQSAWTFGEGHAE